MANLGNRIIVLIDMDCFFCQVETRLQPEFAGKPLAVVQYNQWKLGGIIAVNYEAREFGVTRHMRGDEAKEKCPELLLASVPCLRGKADTGRYRSAGREVIDVLKNNCNIVERASIDEAYLDITQLVDDKLSKKLVEYEDILMQLKNTFIVGYSESGVNDEDQRQKGIETWLSELSEDIQIQRLAIAGTIVEHLRQEIFDTTGFRCSAGISFNKILAKLACGLHKPNRQTILPESAVPELFGTLPVKKVRNLGGKLGDIVVDSLKCNVMGDLLPYSLQYLQNRFDDKTGLWLFNIARGIDNEPVTPRLVSKSIGACKKFPGKQAIVELNVLKHWLGDLSEEVCERLEQDLEENERRASLLTVSFQFYQNKTSVSQSRSCALTSYKPEKVAEQCLNIVTKATQQMPVSFLGISAGKFIKAKGSENFKNFFKPSTTDKSVLSNDEKNQNDLKQNQNDLKENQELDYQDNVDVFEDQKNCLIEQEKDDENLKSSESKINLQSSPSSSIQSSLKTDNFKQSFFMNILKQKQTKSDILETVATRLEHSFEADERIDLSKNTNSNNCQNAEDDATVNSCSVSTETIHNHPSSADNIETVRLQEIFPDLNDIDPNIVKLLPVHLQQEAKKFLKMKESRDRIIEGNKIKTKDISKTSKGKCFKSKQMEQKPSIQNFFIKTDVNNDCDNLKKCLQCDQLILIDKFDEHNDYHIAQNLQKEINRTLNTDEVRKRKVVVDSSVELKKRLSDTVDNNFSKSKPISSFFQQ